MNKKNEDLLQSIQRMEEKIKKLTRENVEMVRHRPRGTRPRAARAGLPRRPSEQSQPQLALLLSLV